MGAETGLEMLFSSATLLWTPAMNHMHGQLVVLFCDWLTQCSVTIQSETSFMKKLLFSSALQSLQKVQKGLMKPTMLHGATPAETKVLVSQRRCT